MTVSCAAHVTPSVAGLDDGARAFVHARAERPAAAFTKPGEAPSDRTVDVTGAVARPGLFLIGPSLETLKQALEAAGGLAPSAIAVRIHPGDDELWKMFASKDAATTAVEIPVSELSSTPPIYLRSGDVIDAAGSEVPTPSAAPLAESQPTPSVATSATPALISTAPTQALSAPPSAVVAEAPKAAVEPPKPAAETPATGPDAPNPDSESSYDPKIELAKLRNEMEHRLGTLRAEIDKLQAENARLAARLERPAIAPAKTAAAEAAVKTTRATNAPLSVAGKAAETVSSEPERPAEPARAATVLVSGSVRNPGAYPVGDVKTVRGAVRAAGGRADADMAAVELRPDGQRGALAGMGLGMGMQPTKTVVNLVAVDSGNGGDITLHGGEVIFVPPSSRSELPR